MPRPGPRPYECVRRAWHSDRHQPIRGSLIQEIFRIANEIHRPATKKNKEWQEKLPIVVLKAEEIMYSKANSEAEYVDVDTLWSRVNDAINTIIRRDESTETGELLLPCIEAALQLGCPARRASRSQRNNTPRFYLNPEKNETFSIPPSNVQVNYATTCSFLPLSSSNFLATNKVSSSNTCVNSDSRAIQKKICDQLKFPFSPNTCSPSVIHQHIPSGCYSSSPCSVYPLYYGNQVQFEDSKSRTPCKSNSQLIEADSKSVMKKLSCGADAQDVVSQADNQCVSEIPPGNGCDLSLRLGPLVVPRISVENSWTQEVEDSGLGTAKVGSKSSDLSSQPDKGFSFFPEASAYDMLEFSSTRRSYMTQNLSSEAALRKRKVTVSHPSEDRQFSWPLKLPFKQFNASISNAEP